jgi:transposase
MMSSGPESKGHSCLRATRLLAALDGEFAKLYADSGRPSIAPERLLRALLLQAFYTIRSESQLMEQLNYNLLYRWFVGLGVDEPVWVPFSKNCFIIGIRGSGCGWRFTGRSTRAMVSSSAAR